MFVDIVLSQRRCSQHEMTLRTLFVVPTHDGIIGLPVCLETRVALVALLLVFAVLRSMDPLIVGIAYVTPVRATALLYRLVRAYRNERRCVCLLHTALQEL